MATEEFRNQFQKNQDTINNFTHPFPKLKNYVLNEDCFSICIVCGRQLVEDECNEGICALCTWAED